KTYTRKRENSRPSWRSERLRTLGADNGNADFVLYLSLRKLTEVCSCWANRSAAKGVCVLSVKVHYVRRALIMGLVLAVAGFCYVTGTNTSGAGRATGSLDAGPRLVGSSNLRFTNPLLPGTTNIFDLGDAAYGSIIQRYVTAAGGVRLYTYSPLNL